MKGRRFEGFVSDVSTVSAFHVSYASDVVHATVATLASWLIESGRVELPGLGVFIVRTRKARRIRHPAGHMMRVPATKSVLFRAALPLSKALNKGRRKAKNEVSR